MRISCEISSDDLSLAVEDWVGDLRLSVGRLEVAYGSLFGPGSCGGVWPTGDGVAYSE